MKILERADHRFREQAKTAEGRQDLIGRLKQVRIILLGLFILTLILMFFRESPMGYFLAAIIAVIVLKFDQDIRLLLVIGDMNDDQTDRPNQARDATE